MSDLPQYYVYEGRPVVFVGPPGGGLDCLAVSPQTGEFLRDMSYVRKIRYGTQADIETLTRDEFVQRVEEYRARHVKGEGPVHALYETINGLEDTARAEGRDLTAEEAALVRTLRERTHGLFEAELRARGRGYLPGANGHER
ncbi:hypothetical protein [Actinomadura sp. SCN-SB]|uniref:hypothetical protein n=1 Tax=Actinomadura sp. SCN-SB TaxID=3373092 RepID=UPI003753089D